MYTDISIDLETLGTTADCTILSIGAVAFNRHEEGNERTFHEHALLGSQTHRSVDSDTLLWWLGQSDAARNAIIEGQKDAIPLVTVLHLLSNWVKGCENKDIYVWGNGASFDNAILSHAFKEYGVTRPWKYSKDRCLRTLCDDAGFDPKSMPFEGVKHDALADAAHQVRIIRECLRLLKK